MKPHQAQIFDLPFFTPEFRKAWDEWLTYRAERKLPKYVPTGLQKTFSKLIADSHNDEKRAIAIIERAMAGNWQGLHPDKAEVIPLVPKKFNNEFMKKPKPAELRPMTDEEMDEWIAGYRGKENNVLFLPTEIYDYLKDKGIWVLTDKQWNWCLLKAIPFRKKELSEEFSYLQKFSSPEMLKHHELHKFYEMENKGEFTGEEVTRLKDLAKKIAINEYFKK